MPPIPIPVQVALLVMVTTAAVYDFRFRRIPNWLVLAGLVAGFGLNSGLGRTAGLRLAAGGFGLAFGVYLLLYLIRAMGAGDVKLMGAVGSFVGAANWFPIFLLTAVLGGMSALILVLAAGRLRRTLWNVGYIVGELARFRAPYMTREELDVKSAKAVTLPHGVVIALGTGVFLLLARVYG